MFFSHAQIDRCRPYFICLMGERFGWCQPEGTKDDLLDMTFNFALENQPKLAWIGDYRFNTSVTQVTVLVQLGLYHKYF